MERNLFSVINGLIEKRMSWERNRGNDSKIATRAFELSLKRPGGNTPEDDVDNWLKAENEVCQRYMQELTSQLA